MSRWFNLRPIVASLIVALAGTFPGAASAQDLIIATATDTTSIDPHFQDLGPNQAIRQHVFDSLVHIGPKNESNPGLATEWTRGPDPLLWVFKLRRGVKFHDGSPFTAKDAAFSIERAPVVPNSPATLSRRVADIAKVEIVDDFTLRIVTKTPTPILPNNLAYLAIVSHKIGIDAQSTDFNNGKHATGTGPYKFVEFVPGERTVFAANADYWGGKPRWQKVTVRPMVNAASRTAALLAGDVHVISDVSPTDIPRLKSDNRLTVTETVSNRIIFWTIDVFRDQALHVTALDGSSMPNPLKDLRVRQAINLAIDRQAIVDRVMDGLAVPANQIVPAGFTGYTPDLVPPKPDLERARKLMAEAGHEKGFQLTIHTTNNRYINDARTAQTIAQMVSRIGIKVNVTALPVAVYFGAARKNEYTFPQVGWGNLTGDAAQVLREALKTGFINNYGRWSNPAFDRLLDQADNEIDMATREDLLRQATRIAINDVAIIPTHWQVNVWAAKKGLRYVPRIDELTYAMMVEPE
ncbi:MAG: ABC transporter substrate-binding protein [Alphaproteobacteria bacterium]|nr:ABC transporter substrate-binding protein [Alphaproteobacteria bacterium]